MSMTREQIDQAIKDRLVLRWSQHCHLEGAAPVAVIAVKQLAGPGFGTPVVCMTEDMDDAMLADLLIGIGNRLKRDAALRN